MSAADAEADVRLVRVRGRLLLDATASDVPIPALGEQLITGARALLNVGAAGDAELLARAVLDLDDDATNDLVRGGARRMLGVARREQGDLDEAVEHLRAAAAEQRGRLENEAEDRHRRGLAAALFDLGVALRQKGELDDAVTELGEAVELLVVVGGTEDEGAAGAASARDLAMARRNLGVAQRDRGDLDDALVSLGDAVSSLRSLTQRQPTALHQRELVAALRSLGSTQRVLVVSRKRGK
jgi:tetratricopeptide (TPR) repeat protein